MKTSSMADLAALLGRVLLGAIFVWDGWGKLISPGQVQAGIALAGLPLPVAAWAVAVAIELGLGLALLLGLYTRTAALILAGWCLVLAVLFHANWADRNMQIHFLKNVSMAGGLLYATGFGAGSFSLDALRRRRRGAVPA